MGNKKLSNELEEQLVKEYSEGVSTTILMSKYGFASRKSIIDKVKKYSPTNYKEIISNAKTKRKDYDYKLEKIQNEFDAYYLGLLLTDGYIAREREIGLDLIDEDCIKFISEGIGKSYKTYQGKGQDTHRIIFSDIETVKNLERLGVVPNKTMELQPPNLYTEEEKFLPYIIRGIIDGDGCVSPTSYGGAQFHICTMSKDFADWIEYILTEKFFMKDIHKRQTAQGIWRIDSSNQQNILKLISIVYDKPFGMMRKYTKLRETFRDYNTSPLI